MRPRLEVDAARSTALALDAISWRIGASHRLTVVAKCMVQLAPGGVCRPLPPEPLVPGTSELSPALPHAQVTLVGHAYAPIGTPRGMLQARVGVTRGSTVLLDKTVLVYGDRHSPADLPRPFVAMPLVHERAPRSGWNPIGRAIARGDLPPNLVPSSPSQPMACFAPIPPSFPSRAGMYAPAALQREADVLAFGLFDFRWFQDAPFDQWVTRLEGDETLILEGLSPYMHRVTTELPGLLAHASWWGAGGLEGRLRLRLDRIDLDVDRGVASLVWRGHFSLPPGASAGDVLIRVVAAPSALAEIAAASAPAQEPAVEQTLWSKLDRLPEANPGHPIDLNATSRLAPLTDEQMARARDPMPFRASAPGAIFAAPPPAPGPSMEPTLASVVVPAAALAPVVAAPVVVAPVVAAPVVVAPVVAAPVVVAPAVVAPAVVAAVIAPPVVMAPAIEVAVAPAAAAPASRVVGDVARLLDGALQGEALRAADLGGASLENADLTGRDLRGAKLAGAVLDGAKLRGARLGEADLSNASLRGADLDSASLEGATLAGADLAGATLRGAALARASLRGATLTEADFSGANLERVNLDDARAGGVNFAGAVLRGATMWRARCEKASFRQAVLDELDAEDAHFDEADMARSRAERGRFVGARFAGARLDDVEWPHAVLDGAFMVGAFLIRAVMTRASFVGADLSRADLREASLRAAALSDALCVGTMFDRTDLRGADLVGAALSDDALGKARTTGAKRG